MTPKLVDYRNNGLGLSEWQVISEALSTCSCLEQIVDFRWSRPVLAGGVTDLDLEKKEIGDLDAVVLSALLPRTASSLTALRLRCVETDSVFSAVGMIHEPDGILLARVCVCVCVCVHHLMG